MLLMTTITPRKDGTVVLRGTDGKPYTFRASAPGGDLVCDVPDMDTVAAALKSGSFEPVNDADMQAAAAMLEDEPQGGNDGGGSDGGSGDDDGDEDEGSPDAPPVEANTPPAPAAATRATRARRAP
jgi:hypothetical protein